MHDGFLKRNSACNCNFMHMFQEIQLEKGKSLEIISIQYTYF